jgi:hypothetical protein
MKKISKFEIFLNEAVSSDSMTAIKQNIYIKAKTEYMTAIADLLKKEGIKVSKINNPYNNIDDFTSDSFTCAYGGETFQIDMSNRGVSLGLDAQRKDSDWNRAVGTKYYTKVKTFADAIKAAIDRQ